MAKNLGKRFEAQIKKDFKKATTPHYLLRLYDQMSGYSCVQTPCDFTLFAQGGYYLLELKAVGGRLNFNSNITNNQIKSLDAASKIEGVVAGILVWFKQYDFTCFIPIQEIIKRIEGGYKSVGYTDIDNVWHLPIHGRKKIKMIEYNADLFIEQLGEMRREIWQQ